MKTSFIACLALANSFAFAAPAVDSALVDRATVSPYYAPSLAILTSLYSDIQQYTAVMNATSATLKPNTPSQNTPALTATYKSNIASINTAVTGATANVKKTLASPPPAKRDLALASRQAAVSLPGELALILEEIGGALNEIIATLGLIVEQLLDGILGGLSAALVGLVL
ncbi:hypothetical protein BDR22DRAFT_821754 [Usnea florida]